MWSFDEKISISVESPSLYLVTTANNGYYLATRLISEIRITRVIPNVLCSDHCEQWLLFGNKLNFRNSNDKGESQYSI